MPTILFHRQYDRYSGGQQKVLDYFDHCLNHPRLSPYISWGDRSTDITGTPWEKHRSRIVYELSPGDYDLAFLAGMDWQDYLTTRQTDQPVINLIQHVRHAEPASNVYPYLSQPATRICVSQEVKAAIDATARVSGTTFAIPNGIDVDYLDTFTGPKKPGSIYILGFKQPDLARELKNTLDGHHSVTCHVDHVDRDQVLKAMAGSEISILLPHFTEGFFLPALEAMKLSKVVIVPDCVGNRSFCRDNDNCLMPTMNTDSILASVKCATDARIDFAAAAQETVAKHTLERERESYFELLSSELGVDL